MAITTLTSGETGANSLIDINANFVDLDTTKADLASPTFTGSPTLPTGTIATTQTASNNSTKVATTAYVDNQVTNFGGGSLFSTTQVSTGTAPNSTFTDLDLSSVIGVAQKVVLLKVTNTTGSAVTFAFRKNGDTGTHDLTNTVIKGLGTLNIDATDGIQYVIVCTDTSGVIEWTGNGAGVTANINMVAYW